MVKDKVYMCQWGKTLFLVQTVSEPTVTVQLVRSNNSIFAWKANNTEGQGTKKKKKRAFYGDIWIQLLLKASLILFLTLHKVILLSLSFSTSIITFIRSLWVGLSLPLCVCLWVHTYACERGTELIK